MIPAPATAARAAAGAALAAAALGTLSGCATGTTGGGTGSTADASAAAALAKASGTWTASGQYDTPGGTESVTVTLKASGGDVTAVTVQGSHSTPNAVRYQDAFASGVAEQVVGKPLATLQVGAVSGSSLTANGFNAAVAKIRDDAS